MSVYRTSKIVETSLDCPQKVFYELCVFGVQYFDDP